MAKLKSQVGSLFLRIFLIISWVLLVAVFVAAALLTIWPNITQSAAVNNSSLFGVWLKTTSGETTTISTNLSWIGWTLIGVTVFALIFTTIIQIIGRHAKFSIGSRNQIMGYFSTVIIPVVIYVVFAFVGTYPFKSLTVPGYGTVNTMFYVTNTALIGNSTFPLLISINMLQTMTWVWWIFLIISFVCLINIGFSTIKMIFRAVFSKTHEKKYITED